MSSSLLVIANPAAGGHGRPLFEETLARLRAHGEELDVRHTTARGDAEALACAAQPGRCGAVLAAGGDGTINEVVNGLAGRGIPLGILPLGTVNVLAREIGLGAAPTAATVARGRVRTVRPGRVNGRLFAVMAGVGFDARVVARVSLPLKRRLGRGAYVVALVRELAASARRPLRVVVDGEESVAANLVVTKGTLYAGSYVVAPRASLEADTFEVLLFARGGALATLSAMAAGATGRLDRLAGLRVITARSVEVLAPEGDPVQGDGDLVGRLPARIDVDERALPLLCPV